MPQPLQIEEFIRDKVKAAINAFYDAHEVVRPGREPDVINGRWCIKCGNSLPLDWKGPCDVCSYEPKPISLEGVMN